VNHFLGESWALFGFMCLKKKKEECVISDCVGKGPACFDLSYLAIREKMSVLDALRYLGNCYNSAGHFITVTLTQTTKGGQSAF
jgi:hypothetical protein